MHILFLLFGAALLYFLQCRVYTKHWDHNLSIQIRLSDDHAMEGDKLLLTEEVINQKLLPLPVLRVKFETSRNLIFDTSENSNISDRYYRDDLLSVLMYQRFTRTLKFLCSHRGYYRIDQADVVCNDLFFATSMAKHLPLSETLYVYPKLLDYELIEVPFQQMLGDVLTKRFYHEDPFEFAGIREYQTYDNMKSINWKASARTGSLKVNQHGYTASQQVMILLNLEDPALLKHDALMEASISLAATYAHTLIQQGIPVSLYSNGCDIMTQNQIAVPAGSGLSHMKQINEALSRIDLAQVASEFLSFASAYLTQCSASDHLLLISCSQKKELQDQLQESLQSHVSLTWIVPLDQTLPDEIRPELTNISFPFEIQESA